MTIHWIKDALAEIQALGLSRQLRVLSSAQGPVIEVEGRQLLNFSSNDYLGLAADPRLIRAAQTAVWRWGTGAGSARLIAGNLGIFDQLEKALAKFLGVEAALLFPSGYQANLGAISALVGRGDTVFSDELNHASIIDGCRLSRAEIRIYRHADPEHLQRLLAESTAARRKLVVTESVFSMEGDLAPLPELLAAARDHGAMFMVDEAHALGVVGPTGRGGLEECGVSAAEADVVMGTLGKALGSAGAFVAGSRRLIEFLINRARTFIFTTGPAPGAAGAALEALRLVEEPWRRERVLAHAARVRTALAEMGFDTGHAAAAIVPVIVGEPGTTIEISRQLWERGIYLPGIRPPTVPPGTSRLRINLSAAHTDEHINILIKDLTAVFPRPSAQPVSSPGG